MEALPAELLGLVVTYLRLDEIWRLSRVNRSLYHLITKREDSKNKVLWQVFLAARFPNYFQEERCRDHPHHFITTWLIRGYSITCYDQIGEEISLISRDILFVTGFTIGALLSLRKNSGKSLTKVLKWPQDDIRLTLIPLLGEEVSLTSNSLLSTLITRYYFGKGIPVWWEDLETIYLIIEYARKGDHDNEEVCFTSPPDNLIKGIRSALALFGRYFIIRKYKRDKVSGRIAISNRIIDHHFSLPNPNYNKKRR